MQAMTGNRIFRVIYHSKMQKIRRKMVLISANSLKETLMMISDSPMLNTGDYDMVDVALIGKLGDNIDEKHEQKHISINMLEE